MADQRSLTDKLLAMATQDASPAERDNARAILEAKGMWPPPPRAAQPTPPRPMHGSWADACRRTPDGWHCAIHRDLLGDIPAWPPGQSRCWAVQDLRTTAGTAATAPTGVPFGMGIHVQGVAQVNIRADFNSAVDRVSANPGGFYFHITRLGRNTP